jgi:hypothetical protein
MDRRHSDAHDIKYLPDEWAIGVETLGLDDATVQDLIKQVNEEAYRWGADGSRESVARVYLGTVTLTSPTPM